MLRHKLAAALLGIVAGLSPAALAAPVQAVMPSGNAVLYKCRSWIFFHTCKSYDKIELPQRVAVGDRIRLSSYGSNPKDYVFRVVEIRRKGEGCVLLSDASEGREDRERIEIAHCEPVAKQTAEPR